MPELIGQTLSHYRITAALGAGGMGEVYRATDANLGRDVAIKVLPPEVAQDPDRLARFKREAHLLAALNHPHIAAIYGLEEADGKPFLALELVEGEDLKQRLARGPIPIDEALELATQVAEALEEAHNKGIVHRDLKPANVKLTADGQVKVLDFGLAKAWAGDASGLSSAASALSQSPTMANTGTVAGVILGTAAYMSPEQARGKPVDKRADVWSFGVLLWEMLTGRQLFTGDTVTDVIAAVVKEEPDLAVLPKETPAAVRRLISRCLRKDPRTRLPDIGAARLELRDALAGSAEEATGTGAEAVLAGGAEVTRLARQRSAWAAAFLVAAGIAGWLAAARLTDVAELHPAAHFVIEPPEGRGILAWGAPAVSPDGRQVAFATFGSRSEETWLLATRALDSVVTREIPRTEGAHQPFWSPDSRSIAFFAANELKRIDLESGAVQKICGKPQTYTAGGDWAEGGTILFSGGGSSARIFTVPTAGGEAKPLTTLDESRGETAHWWPRLLPDGRHFLFEVNAKQPEQQGLYVASLDEPGARRRWLPTLTRADYQSRHLLFVRDQTLLAQPFDEGRGTPAGEPIAVAHPVEAYQNAAGWGWFSARKGTLLAYKEGAPAQSELVWFDRKGARLGTVGDPADYLQLALAPDERQAAVQVRSSGEGADIWTVDLARGVGTRQTSGPGDERSPTWSNDGRAIFFAATHDGRTSIHRKGLHGGEPEAISAASAEEWIPESVSPDGRDLLCHLDATGRHTIGAVSLTGDATPRPILKRPDGHGLDEPQLSPDGRFLAYGEQESGTWQVFVEPYGRKGERVRISTDSGAQPEWRGDGREIFYITRAGGLAAVEVRATSDRLDVSLPEVLFHGLQWQATIDTYAVTRDGQRFLAIIPVGTSARGRVHVVTNWTSLLEKR